MLAGRLKLKYFLTLVGAFSITVVVLLVQMCKSDKPPPRPQEVVNTPPTPTPTPPTPTPTPTPTPRSAGELAARPHDADVIAWSTRSISGDKQKDVSKGKPYKINVYKDAGHSTVNRAKVDVNRNDKWDEKYTFEPDRITLEIAPADDEHYTETYHWTGSAWLPEGAEAPAPQPTEATAQVPSSPSGANVDLPARSYDAEVIAWKDRTASGGKLKDVSKGKPYKINVYQDAGASHVNRAKVDANRNDKWDEKYTFEPAKITLQRAPADDEHYSETYHWTGSGWSKQ